MIDERFSPAAFAALAPDSTGVRRLCHELEAEVAAEMHRAAEAAFRQVAEQLRRLGHDLPEEESQFSPEHNGREYAYRRGESVERERFHLRIHFDTQVCAFYPTEEQPAVVADETGQAQGGGA